MKTPTFRDGRWIPWVTYTFAMERYGRIDLAFRDTMKGLIYLAKRITGQLESQRFLRKLRRGLTD